jgi:hypothetical protein
MEKPSKYFPTVFIRLAARIRRSDWCASLVRWWIALASSVLMFSAISAFGQAEVTALASALWLQKHCEALRRHASDLTDMSRALSRDERDIAGELHTVAMSGSASCIAIADLVALRGAMINTKDRAEVMALLDSNKNSFSKECEENIRYINSQIGSSQSPGVVSEATRLRESLDAACTRVRSLH